MPKKSNSRKKNGNVKAATNPPEDRGTPPVCKFLREGRCKQGLKCTFFHSPEAAASGARIQAIKSGKSTNEADMAATVAFKVAERRLILKAEELKKASMKEDTKSESLNTHENETTLEGEVKSNHEIINNESNRLDETTPVEGCIDAQSLSIDECNSIREKEPKYNEDIENNQLNKIEEIETIPESNLPIGLMQSLSLFSPSQQELAKSLCEVTPGNQRHLFEHWSTDSSFDEKKKDMMCKLESVDQSYPDGGLHGYIVNAVRLLEKSRQGENPLEGWTPSVPKGQTCQIGTQEFLSTENLGLEKVGKCGFILVAGGLGERLGYGNIKIGLPTELATETSYIQLYIETILAFQSRYAKPGQKLPLCIMTSEDTNAKTVALLTSYNCFGMEKDQITIVQQGKGVPALCDNDAHIALDPDDPYNFEMKPHGHGDIHSLLHSHGVAKSWLKEGIEWIVFFQDTNGLAFNTLPLSLGVSSKLGLIMNSITCPRKAKQAIGAIIKLTKGDQQRTINVEYNQLDPLLRATGYPDGDVNDETGFSPFPGNINQLLFRLEDYVKVLERTKGVMPEFVNPKYKDSTKTVFKKPTRLECMMQDFPTVLDGAEVEKVGFTSLASELCFSPVKNASSDGCTLQANGTHAGVAATGEADQSGAMRQLLRSIGCNVEEGVKVKFIGIEVVSGPDCILKPSFALCSNELKKKFTNPSAVRISGRSSLVLQGDGLVIESLDLDGAAVIECEDGAHGIIQNLVIRNKGWVKVSDEANANEIIKMRGYHILKIETEKILFKKDGSIEGNYSPLPVASEVLNITESKGAEKDMPLAESFPLKCTSEIEVQTKSPSSLPTLDLSRPASSEQKDADNFCGGTCSIM